MTDQVNVKTPYGTIRVAWGTPGTTKGQLRLTVEPGEGLVFSTPKDDEGTLVYAAVDAREFVIQ